MKRRFLTAEWRHLLMLNYEVDPAVLRAPRGTEIDSWNGKTFLSVVGFLFLGTRVLGVPVPFHRNFEEVNLRLYVRRQAGDEARRGVVFVKEIVPKIAIAAVARWIYNENYWPSHAIKGPAARPVERDRRFGGVRLDDPFLPERPAGGVRGRAVPAGAGVGRSIHYGALLGLRGAAGRLGAGVRRGHPPCACGGLGGAPRL